MKTQTSILSFDNLVSITRETFNNNVSDHRRKLSVEYPLSDVLMSGLAMFHFQCPSLLNFQKQLEDLYQTSNLTTLFGVSSVPKSSQFRSALDKINPAQMELTYNEIHKVIAESKILRKYRFLNGRYLCLMDGSEYFSSKFCSCSNCLEKKHKNGTITYHHQILQCVIAKPGFPVVLPLDTEEICRQDGHEKQDCELNAGKRILDRIKKNHYQMDIVVVADGLYSHVPFIKLLREKKLSFILVAKPDDHVAMMAEVDSLRKMGEVGKLEFSLKDGGKEIYEFLPQVPLRSDGKDTVNWYSFTKIDKEGKILYKNSWVTDLPVNAKNIVEMVEAGRCRWKVENECFNTIKNQGYHIEHNFGHGKEHLSYNLFILNMIAFLIHEILELSDKLFQKVREKIGTRYMLWERMRTFVNSLIIPDWTTLLNLLLKKGYRIVVQSVQTG